MKYMVTISVVVEATGLVNAAQQKDGLTDLAAKVGTVVSAQVVPIRPDEQKAASA